MPPSLEVYDSADYGLRHSVLGRKRVLRSAFSRKSPYNRNILIFKLGAHVARTFNNRLPSLRYSIIHVVVISAKEKVIRVAAFSIIAFVTHLHSVWNLAICKKPRNPMGFELFDLSNPKHSIPTTIHGPIPIPTIRIQSNIDVGPKSFLRWISNVPCWPSALFNKHWYISHFAH